MDKKVADLWIWLSSTSLGVGLFFWLFGWERGRIPNPKESIMLELLNLCIAILAILVTLFSKEIREWLRLK